MKKLPLLVLAAVVLAAALHSTNFGAATANSTAGQSASTSANAAPSNSNTGDTQAVKAAAAEFYRSLNVMFTGDLEPMKKVWSHAEDVTYMGPGGGFQVGWSKVLPVWESQAAMKLGGKVEPTDMHVNVGQDLAVVSDVEVGENKGPDGKVSPVSIRATNIFRKEDGAWKLIGHHTDLLPNLAK